MFYPDAHATLRPPSPLRPVAVVRVELFAELAGGILPQLRAQVPQRAMQRLVHRVFLDPDRFRDLVDGLFTNPSSIEHVPIPRSELVHRREERATPLPGKERIVRVRS